MQTTNIIPEDEEEFNYQNISQKENKESDIFSQINTCQSNNIMNTSINNQNKNEIKINENYKNNSQIISYKENQSFQLSENNENYNEYHLKNMKKSLINKSNKNSIEKENKIIDLLRKLIYNAKKGDKENLLNILEKLIDEEINLNYRDEMGFSVLHYAVDEGNFKICEILIKTNLIDVNLKSLNEGKSPLHISCQHGYFDISKLLLLNNAEINISDNERNSPLHYSIQGNYFEITKLLINYLKDISIFKKKNIYGQNIMNLAYNSKNEKIRDLFENYSDKTLISEENNLNKTEMNLLNLALSPNSNKRNRLIRSKGVLYSNPNNLCSSHKKLVSYMNKYSSHDYNKEKEYNINNNNNNAKKKIYHLHSISSMNDEISNFNPLTVKNIKNIKENKNNDLNNKNNNSHVTTNSDLFNISQSSYKTNSNFKSSTTANTLGTINSNISNNSIGSCNKIKNEDKKESKKNLTGTDKKKNYHKIIHISNTNSNVTSSSKSKNKKQIRGESKKKRDESKRLFIELSDSDINDKKNPKIESVTIDLNEIQKEIEENKLKNKSKSRNFKLSDNNRDKSKDKKK